MPSILKNLTNLDCILSTDDSFMWIFPLITLINIITLTIIVIFHIIIIVLVRIILIFIILIIFIFVIFLIIILIRMIIVLLTRLRPLGLLPHQLAVTEGGPDHDVAPDTAPGRGPDQQEEHGQYVSPHVCVAE